MVTIDEVVDYERAKATELRSHIGTWSEEHSIKCEEWAREHEQIAEWLEDYKRIKMLIPIEQALKAEYNKALDDFTEKIRENISESLIWGMIADCFKYKNMNDTSDKIVDYVISTANDIAEQLKAGGENNGF